MCLAIPGKIEAVDGADALTRTGKVNFGGVVKDVSLACVPEAGVGDYVIVEEEAGKIFEYVRQMEELAGSEGRGP
jgi:hydrogenase expression/formation protein HypC